MSWLDRRDVPNVVLENPPLREVICQVRFPSVLRLQADPLLVAQIQDRLRGAYPNVESQAVFQIAVLGDIQDVPSPSLAGRAWRLTTVGGDWAIAVASDFVSLSTQSYKEWQDFATRIEPILTAVFDTAGIKTTTRIGLRYSNVIAPVPEASWDSIINPDLLGWLRDPGAGIRVTSAQQEVRLEVEDVLVGFRHGILPADSPVPSGYLVDIDCYTDAPLDATSTSVIDRIRTFNDVANRLFFNTLTEEGLKGFGPKPKGD